MPDLRAILVTPEGDVMPLSWVIFPACAGVLREANYNDPIPRVSGGVPGTPANRKWTDSDLSESGKLVFSQF